MQDNELLNRAHRAYYRAGSSGLGSVSQPCNAESYINGNIVELSNANGVLARYKVTPSGRLRRLEVGTGE